MKIRFVNPRSSVISVLSVVFLTVGLFVVWQTVNSQAQTLNLGDLIIALRSQNGTLAQRNSSLTGDVRRRGVNFPLTAEIEKIIRDEGANNDLIEAIRGKLSTSREPTTPHVTTTRTTANRKEIKNSVGMEFVLIPKGTFTMGGSLYDKEYDDTEGPQRKVTLNYDFYLGKYEVTQKQWKAVMGDNPSEFPECGENCPVENINWNEASEFIKRMNAKNDGYVYRLPSEAEWEYAARAGTTTQFYWGEDLNYTKMCEYANVPDRSALAFNADWKVAGCNDGYKTTAPVGKFLPNNFGVYDMSGNIWEWVEDIDSPNYNGLPTDGSANLTKGDTSLRVLRGGSWGFRPWDLRLTDRTGVTTEFESYVTGFRVALRVR